MFFKFIENLECETAGEFIDALSPYGRHFRKYLPNDYVFRGHGDDAYDLLPSALRGENSELLHQLAGTCRLAQEFPDLNIAQWIAEARIIYDFLEFADSSGLELPEDSYDLRSLLGTVRDSLEHAAAELREKQRTGQPYEVKTFPLEVPLQEPMRPRSHWPPAELLPVIALAQHHGLPTRILDWSRSPYTAAYFAAIDACKKPSKSGKVAVWGLRAAPVMFATGGPAVNTRIVTVPRASNANLHAQQGVFTLSEPQNDLGGEPVRRFSISKAYQDFIERCRSAAAPADATRKPSVGTRSRPPDHLINPPALFHLTLPSAEAGKVLWYLDKSHINAARLFPEFGGAARAITERLYQQRPES